MSLKLIHDLELPTRINLLTWHETGKIVCIAYDFYFSVYRVSFKIEEMYSRNENSKIQQISFVNSDSTDVVVFLENKTIYYANENEILLELSTDDFPQQMLYLRNLPAFSFLIKEVNSYGSVDKSFLKFLETKASKMTLNLAVFNNSIALLVNGIIPIATIKQNEQILKCSRISPTEIIFILKQSILKLDLSLIDSAAITASLNCFFSLKLVDYIQKLAAFLKKLLIKESFELKKLMCKNLLGDISKVSQVKDILMSNILLSDDIQGINNIFEGSLLDKNINEKKAKELYYFLQNLEDILAVSVFPNLRVIIGTGGDSAWLVKWTIDNFTRLAQVKEQVKHFFNWVLNFRLDITPKTAVDLKAVFDFIESENFVLKGILTAFDNIEVGNLQLERSKLFGGMKGGCSFKEAADELILQQTDRLHLITAETTEKFSQKIVAGIDFDFFDCDISNERVIFLTKEDVKMFRIKDNKLVSLLPTGSIVESAALINNILVCRDSAELFTIDLNDQERRSKIDKIKVKGGRVMKGNSFYLSLWETEKKIKLFEY